MYGTDQNTFPSPNMESEDHGQRHVLHNTTEHNTQKELSMLWVPPLKQYFMTYSLVYQPILLCYLIFDIF